MSGQTRFFCRCGRLLSVDGSTREVVCPDCRETNAVPRLGAPDPPPKSGAPSGTTASAASRAAASPAATAVLEGGVGGRLGRFELVAVLGQGGMGTVYRARDGAREVALKILHPGLQSRPDFVSRFQREARAVSALHHENIVRLLDSGIERGTPWLAMELIEGDDLLAAAQRGRFAPDQAIALLQQAARGLEAAAKVGITHRDVKPGNLVLRTDGVVKVADFGLAKAVDSTTQLTVTGEILGTPHYMAPEQGRGERVDHRADLYSLGATFYHVLGGAPPHEAETPVAVIMKHLREEPRPLRSLNARVSVGLERVIHRLLQKSADLRYQSYSALLADLERLAEGRDPQGGADPPPVRVNEGGTTYVLPQELPTELVLRPAGGVRRLLAFLVDVAAVELALRLFVVAGRALVGAVPADAAGAGMVARLRRTAAPELHCDAPWKTAALAGGCLVAALVYVTISDARGGRTVGKRWLSLRLCRRDGRDLGLVRAAFRTLLLVPGIVLLMPTLAHALREILECAGLRHGATTAGMAGAGLAWLVVLDLVGRMSALGRPLHDAVVGAAAWKAQRPTRPVRPAAVEAPLASPRRAFFLSIVPGLGVMYAGHLLLGIVALAVIAFLLAGAGLSLASLAVWASSAVAAALLTARRRQRQRHQLARGNAAPIAEPAVVRRQES